MAVMLEYCEFSFKPFNHENSVNSLYQFLSYLDGEELFAYFPSICNTIVEDVLAAVDFLHSRDIVHRDIKPANVLVSNLHYANLGVGSNEMFMSQPIICKLADLGEARSAVTQTRALVGNSRTKFLARGSPAFMAPEISVEEFMVTSASLRQLKAIDTWAVMMTIFVVINPDQRYPFQLDITRLLEEDGKEIMNSEHLLKACLREKKTRSFSDQYLEMQSNHYQRLRKIFCENLLYNPNQRCTVKDLIKQSKEVSDLVTMPLTVSQASALSKSDMDMIKMVDGCTDELAQTLLPQNDGTNSCAFLSLGIIDRLLKQSSNSIMTDDNLVQVISEVITNYPLKFNQYRDSTKMVNVYEASSVLSTNNLLIHEFDFQEKIVDNEAVYSYNFQVSAVKVLEHCHEKARKEKQMQFAVFQAGIYIFAIAITETGEFMAFETHPIGEKLGGNGKGLVVKTTSTIDFLQWISRRLITSGVSTKCTPYVICVEQKRERMPSQCDDSSQREAEKSQKTNNIDLSEERETQSSEDTGEFGQKAEESKSQPSTQKPGDDYVISSSSSDELEITRVVKRR
eukprot:Seg681.5 transcript_id=Seg681.5/GoldUCD/mRNA.D3Y31 product="Serine/threonine-protein kinase TOS3" protein_id=Seg681.5/GoldUCD/D3Y31